MSELLKKQMIIDGKQIGSLSGETSLSINPATEEGFAEIPMGTKEDAENAILAAKKSFDLGKWRNTPPSKKGKILWKLADLIMANRQELAELETKDTGKPIRETMSIDVPMTADVFRFFAGATTKIHGETIPVNGNFFHYTLREPVGVMGLIVPWNFPMLIAARKIAPALACGNSIILKPAEISSLTAIRMAELALEAGLPEGVFNVLTGKGSVVGQALVDSPIVDAITFTGSTGVGQGLMKSGSVNVKKLSLELGGKSPNIVFDDANVDLAIKMAAAAIFYNKGEVCTAGSRLFVQESIYDEVTEKLSARANKMVPGDPMNEGTRLGPVVSKAQFDSVSEYIRLGKEGGAKLSAGGEKFDIGNGGKGYFLKPTVFTDVDNKMQIAQEEIFGPVLSVIKFTDTDDVIRQANDTAFGLASGIWTNDLKKAHQVANRINAGTVWINTYNMYDAASPYGGFKMSGFGKESGMESIYEFYTKSKTVWVDLN
ncbi:MAG: aldehyde dehydrogenase family protein [Calditrichaeota bacterium]|nr:MAG: aldehyde dehydrogenase family protein [Calditrichota bacterium]